MRKVVLFVVVLLLGQSALAQVSTLDTVEEGELGCYANTAEMLKAFERRRPELRHATLAEVNSHPTGKKEPYRAKWIQRKQPGRPDIGWWLYFRFEKCPTDAGKLLFVMQEYVPGWVLKTTPAPAVASYDPLGPTRAP